MPALLPDALVDAPRGARLCLALAEELSADVGRAAFHAARHAADRRLRQHLLQAIEALDLSPLAARREALDLAAAVRETVGAAMYWQEPDDVDLLLDPDLRAALRPVAEAAVRAPAAAWWTAPMDPTALRCVARPDEAGPEELRRDSVPWAQWRDELVARSERLRRTGGSSPASAPSGFWWSTPSKAGVLVTTRPLPPVGAAELLWKEDGTDPDEVDVWPMTPDRPVRVLELDGPDAWVDLVRRHPLDTTGEHRGDWYRLTDRDGIWRTPDWAAVARDVDAVHLTVAGYLTTAARVLDVDGDACTVLAGWSPDETWWLSDVLRPAGPRERWTRLAAFGHQEEWLRAPG